jgi:predicted ATPase
MRLKNWRSLANVTLHFTPLTVFIGANSAGKTNILDAFYFVREALATSFIEAVNNRDGLAKIRTLGILEGNAVELAFIFKLNGTEFEYQLNFVEDSGLGSFPRAFERLTHVSGDIWLISDELGKRYRPSATSELLDAGGVVRPLDDLFLAAVGRLNPDSPLYKVFHLITQRWQMLDENFMPPLSLAKSKKGSPFVIDRCADNVVTLLENMKHLNPNEYQSLLEDAQWLMNHIGHIEVQESDYEVVMRLHEANHEAPTVSAGTSRNIAILTAMHLLNIRESTQPGLVVIEEPDTAIHPLLLGRLVELFRLYVRDEEYPRQVIVTTHNPQMLNYFKHDEVIIVEREASATVLQKIDQAIWDIWSPRFGLGEVWTTRAFGGVPE